MMAARTWKHKYQSIYNILYPLNYINLDKYIDVLCYGLEIASFEDLNKYLTVSLNTYFKAVFISCLNVFGN
jgi:hypothetical protein